MRPAIFVLVALGSGCSCGAECGSGTHESNGTCLPDPVATDSDSDVDSDVDSDTGSDTDTGTGSAGCAANETRCGDDCVDLFVDEANCGACGNACAPGAACAPDPRAPEGEPGVRCTCDPFSAAGCADGEKCSLLLSYEDEAVILTCLPDGTVELGEACHTVRDPPDYYDDCVGGTFCEDDLGTRTCQRLCSVAADCADLQPSYCNYYNDVVGAGGEADLIGRCEPQVDDCNACLQTGCPFGEGCYLNGDGTYYIHRCSRQYFFNDDGTPYAFAGEPGDPCTYTNNCAPGHQCSSVGEGDRSCRKYCGDECAAGGDADTDTDTDTDVPGCDAGDECFNYGVLDVGVCG